jgi:lipopolysaccharide transport system permease protein
MVRYRQTYIGAAWAVLEPILLMITFSIIFGIFARYPSEGIPYPVFFLTGLVVWQVIGKVVGEGTNSVVGAAGLVTRVYFPRIYFPIAVTLTILTDLVLDLAVLGVVLVLDGIVPGPNIVFAPLALWIGLATALGIGLWFGAINVVYRDVTQMIALLTRVWFFATPVIYSVTMIPPEYLTLYYLNPAAVAVAGFRWSIAGTAAPPPEAWVFGLVISSVLLISGYLFFRRREATFSDTV